MANATLDHMVSLTVFIAALLIFIGLFSSSIQTGLAYQRHTALSTKTSDLLDTLLLNPGLPENWGQTDGKPVSFGLQDPEFTQYKVSSYSPMRLTSTTESSVYFSATNAYYSNLTAGFGGYLLTSNANNINYSTASKLLGINGTYGFQLTLSPTITISIQKTSTGTPLKLLVNAAGTGYPFANAALSCSLILVNRDASDYPSYSIFNRKETADEAGFKELTFNGINGETEAYALIVYTYLNGLKGVGYYVHTPQTYKSIVPIVDGFADRRILLAHSDAVGENFHLPTSQISYNASFVILTEEYTLRVVNLEQPQATGTLNSGQSYTSIIVPSNEGILIVPYKDTAGEYGLVLMPWGLGSLGFTLIFGGNPAGQEWVTTDIRQVTIGNIAYQAKLNLWRLQPNGGIG
ncbi:MAG: hypothetical protein NWE98_02580 [Candidatus Bathyarchaeota archaeon]|nr:hypothetical protein [Candidatus Bathyarchaeota archaeon]